MDTELFVHLVARSGADSFEKALVYTAGRAVGAYSLTLLLEGRLFGLRDAHGVRPLVLGEHKEGWVLASETCALDALGARAEDAVFVDDQARYCDGAAELGIGTFIVLRREAAPGEGVSEPGGHAVLRDLRSLLDVL